MATRRAFTVMSLLTLLPFGRPRARAENPEQEAGKETEPGQAVTESGLFEPETLAEILQAYRDLRQRYDRLSEDVNRLSRFSPPVGTVLAYAGPWPPTDPTTKESLTEANVGWALCDGRAIDDPTLSAIRGDLAELLAVLGGDQLPDYRGHFLRGLDSGSGRVLGSVQEWATGKPKNPGFGLTTDGNHSHQLSTRFNAGTDATKAGAEVTMHALSWGALGLGITTNGAHSHTIQNFDGETRPNNVAVHWIIKFRSI